MGGFLFFLVGSKSIKNYKDSWFHGNVQLTIEPPSKGEVTSTRKMSPQF